MLGLPKSTAFNKRISKQKFYENMHVSPDLKKVFVDQVNAIYWRHKIAPSTIPLAAGNKVTELEVFEICLYHPVPNEALLRQIDKSIPYHILFLFECEGKYQAWIGYKEVAASGNKAFKVTGYYHTEWLHEDELPLKLEGLSVDAVYENFVRQIAGNVFQERKSTESLKESVARDERRKVLQKQIERLQNKRNKEKQLNRQMEINGEIKKLKREWEAL